MEGFLTSQPDIEAEFGLAPNHAGRIAVGGAYQSKTERARANEVPFDPSDTDNDRWRQYAACLGLDPNIFFPYENDHLGVQKAKDICSTCQVSTQCLEYALEKNEKFGTWGGATEWEIKEIRKQRKTRKLSA